MLRFLGKEFWLVAAGWTAGAIAVGLVDRFFEVKGLRNLWGLIASEGRTVVTAGDYQLITMLTSYTPGLLMLLLARHLMLH